MHFVNKMPFVSCLMFFCALMFDSQAYAEEKQWHLNLGIDPLGIIYAKDVAGFTATNSGGFISYSEKIEGSAGYAPGGYIGIDYDTGASGIGLDIFFSEIISDVLTGSIYGANASYILPHAEDNIFLARVKGGIVRGVLDWEGDYTRVYFENASGWQAGLAFEVGRKVSFYAEALYRDLKFNVDINRSDATNRNTLDMSGGVVNAGVKFTF